MGYLNAHVCTTWPRLTIEVFFFKKRALLASTRDHNWTERQSRALAWISETIWIMQKNFRWTDWLPGHTFKFRWIEEFTLIDSSRVIRARWREIRRFDLYYNSKPANSSWIHIFSYAFCNSTVSKLQKMYGKIEFLHSRFSVLFLWTRKLLFPKRTPQIYEFRKN